MRTQSQTRRRQILEVAASVFAAKGYHNATVSDIIAGAGIARGTFYLYFEGKRHVFEVLLEHFLDELRGGIESIDVLSDTPPMEQLKENLVRTMLTVCRYRDTALLVLGTIEAPDSQIGERVDGFFGVVKELVASSLRTGKLIGLVREVPEEVATHFVFGAAKEVVKEMVAVGNGKAPDAAATARLAEALVSLSASGILTESGAAAI